MVLGDDGKPMVQEVASEVSSIAETEESKDVDLLVKMREELAVDKQRQQEIQDQLNIPFFNKDENVEIDEDEVSDIQSTMLTEHGGNEADKKEEYNRIKDRIKRQKNKGKEVRGGRLIATMFKLVTSLVDVMNEVRHQRHQERDQGLSDFEAALPLYNEILRSWVIRSVKTPILTIIK